MKLKLLLPVLVLLNIFNVSAAIFDDFSSGELNSSKWEEVGDSQNNTIIHHFVNSNESGRPYHTAQSSPAERSITLIAKRSFIAGETFQYDIYYDLNRSMGNRLSRLYFDDGSSGLDINERYLDVRLNRMGQGNEFPTTGDIGYWNGNSQIGNMAGQYKVRIDFKDYNATIILQNPFFQNVTFVIPLQMPVRFGISSKTGHDGMLHFDYDNFILYNTSSSSSGSNGGGGGGPSINTTNTTNTTNSSCSCNTNLLQQQIQAQQNMIQNLTQRIMQLEQKTNNMYTKTQVDSKINSLKNSLQDLKIKIAALENKVTDILRRISR